MRNSVLLGSFLFLLPAAVIGHDAYVAYNRPELGDIVHAFRFTELGWCWQHYSNDSYLWARENLSEEFWTGFLDKFLRLYSVLLAALPLVIMLVVVGVQAATSKLQMLAVMGSTGAGKAGKGNPTLKDTKGNRVKYKRH